MRLMNGARVINLFSKKNKLIRDFRESRLINRGSNGERWKLKKMRKYQAEAIAFLNFLNYILNFWYNNFFFFFFYLK